MSKKQSEKPFAELVADELAAYRNKFKNRPLPEREKAQDRVNLALKTIVLLLESTDRGERRNSFDVTLEAAQELLPTLPAPRQAALLKHMEKRRPALQALTV